MQSYTHSPKRLQHKCKWMSHT